MLKGLPKPLVLGFLIAVVTLLLNALVPYYFVESLVSTSHRAEASQRLLDTLTELRGNLIEAETGQRGYLLTRNRAYLQPYDMAQHEVQVNLETLHTLLADRPEQEERLKYLEEQAQRKLDELKLTVELMQQGRAEEAERLVANDHGNSMMQTLRATITRLSSAERMRRMEHVYRANSNAELAVLVFVAIALIDALLFGCIFAYLVRIIRSRSAAEVAASEQSVILRGVLNSMHEGVIVADRDGRALLTNPAAERIIGSRLTTFRQAARSGLVKILHADGTPYEETQMPLERALQGDLVVGERLQLVGQHGDTSWLSFNSMPILTESGEQTGGVTVFRDVTHLKRDADNLKALNVQLSEGMAELAHQNYEISKLSELANVLQTCRDEKEACGVLSSSAAGLFQGAPGALYLLAASRNYLELCGSWGEIGTPPQVIQPDDCWAIRRGRVHRVCEEEGGLCCAHVQNQDKPPEGYLCVPMVAQGETMGLLFLSLDGVALARGQDALARFAGTVAEQCALALSNLRLREQLRYQSMHDPLTGLFNRRFLEATLDLELSRSARSGQPLTVAMLDVDHFKRFNDTFGHDAGDVLLREFGAVLKLSSRDSDIACRYGGEEFMLILPQTDLAMARECVERVLQAVRTMEVNYAGQLLGTVTVSAGVADYHRNDTAEGLVKRADTALYQAKTAGRDRLVAAS
ncbi:diguanylate cyclase [Chitinimonas sp.]|uniref:diguanylate cyclase n=1 Tax=Chitinimonas sp. TaxID=1934313 RepID=UPI002F95D13B